MAIVINLLLISLAFFTLLPGVRIHITAKYGAHGLRLLGCNASYKAFIALAEVAAPPLIAGGFGLVLHGNLKTKSAEKIAQVELTKVLSLAKIQSGDALGIAKIQSESVLDIAKIQLDIAKINGDSLVSLEIEKKSKYGIS